MFGFDSKNASPFVQQQEIDAIKEEILAAKQAVALLRKIQNGTKG